MSSPSGWLRSPDFMIILNSKYIAIVNDKKTQIETKVTK